MKKFIAGLIMVLMSISFASAEEEIGKVVTIVGDVDISSADGKKFIPEVGTFIKNDSKIRTGKKSYMELLLNDGSKIFIREVTALNISSLKMKETDPPTKVRMVTGKIRITMKKMFKSRSLLLRTPTAVAGVRGTDFGAIVSKNETKIAVFNGQVEVANSEKDILKSFVVREKEEVSVIKDAPPSEPRLVPQNILETWFDQYDIDEKNRVILKKSREHGILDNLLRKKDF
jgi:hypothetical protein